MGALTTQDTSCSTRLDHRLLDVSTDGIASDIFVIHRKTCNGDVTGPLQSFPRHKDLGKGKLILLLLLVFSSHPQVPLGKYC